MIGTTLYDQYYRELTASLISSLRTGRAKPEFAKSFLNFIPLWTLLHNLQNVTAPNPTKALLLSHFQAKNDIENFLEISRDHSTERQFGPDLRQAHQATLFTSYFAEIISDSLSFVNAFHLSNYRGCVIALRCMLEDVYRHIYYRDNREYFIRVHELGESEHNLKLSPSAFRQYLEKSSFLKPLTRLNTQFVLSTGIFKGIHALNNELYGRTSSFVHGSAPSTLNGFTTNTDISFDAIRATAVLELATNVNFVLTAFLSFTHLDQLAQFNEGTKRIVFDAFGSHRSSYRRALRI